MNALDEFAEAFAGSGASIAYVGNNANYGVGPDLFFRQYHLVCLDYSPLVDSLLERGRSVFCLEKELSVQNAVFRSTPHLLEQKSAIDFLKAVGATHLQLFKNSSVVETAAALNRWEVLSSRSSLSQGLENKFRLDEIAAGARVAVPSSERFPTRSADFGRLSDRLGKPFVVQAAKGFAGSKTFLVGSAFELDQALVRLRSSTLKASRLVSGVVATVNACATARGTIIGPPAYQITGVSLCTANPLGSCGNDFTHGAFGERLGEINSFVASIGGLLVEQGYHGIFGVDFIIGEKDLTLIEVNPRITASLPLQTALSFERGEVPLIAYHYADFLDLEPRLDPAAATALVQRPLEAASVILYNTRAKTARVRGEMRAGVYRLANNLLELVRTGISVLDCSSPEEVFVSPAALGKLVNPGIEYARLYFKRGVLASNGSFHPEVEKIVRAVHDAQLGP